MVADGTVNHRRDEPPGLDAAGALLAARASTKSFSDAPVPVQLLTRLLAVAVGDRADGGRAYPSAHALHPVDVFVAVGKVDGLQAGAYRFDNPEHALTPGARGDHRRALAQATLDAGWAAECPALLLLTADLDAADRAFDTQGSARGSRYCWIEVGAIAENIHICAAALGLGTVFLGGIDDDAMRTAAEPIVEGSRSVLGLMPLGFAAR
ncbi:SagB/ThcOx family dehydrogenase [Tomitella cavernea]|uniref:Nitroreductase domain-containing protein n=1 Tax=Tomitella cavernea TaxID=1387982 RepID=A0ABP9C486_9ACTN|nr:SagB/ThcOx family dehydrogenase [Tomitella cavernea]